jgi:hypothetical protein
LASSTTIGIVREIMGEFAERTGIGAGAASPARRYLWTDAFAVCNFLGLHEASGERAALERALRLVAAVHATLGRHRPDDRRTGWISGLGEEEGRLHPTRGGLRIGKPRNERGPDEPEDARLEWERDGQYYHYLTRWMHALARVAGSGGDVRHLRWAIELALATHAGFTRSPRPGEARRLAWKMSIDLSRPLVAAMGQHDPLDGLTTYQELRHGALRARLGPESAALEGPIAELRSLCQGLDWSTVDPLGLGGLLCDAGRLAQLSMAGPADTWLVPRLLEASARGLAVLVRSGELEGPASRRLAFRELGLSIGLHALERLAELVQREPVLCDELLGMARRIEALLPFVPLAGAMERYWLEPAHQATDAWRAHLDINAVMLATSLLPDGFLAP